MLWSFLELDFNFDSRNLRPSFQDFNKLLVYASFSPFISTIPVSSLDLTCTDLTPSHLYSISFDDPWFSFNKLIQHFIKIITGCFHNCVPPISLPLSNSVFLSLTLFLSLSLSLSLSFLLTLSHNFSTPEDLGIFVSALSLLWWIFYQKSAQLTYVTID